jgi:light-regulated signal transduction histidine kinase (bacteriophytochrome)
VGKPLVIYIARDHRQAFYALLRQLSEKPGKQTAEAGIRTPAGILIPVHLTVASMSNSGNVARGLRWLLRDITAQVQMTNQLRALNAELETRVLQRTAALQRSNEELQQFAYVVSHDLQEPLRTVGAYLQLLESRQQNALDAEAKEFIGFAVDGARRMQNLISDLLTYSRVQAPERRLVETHCEQILTNVLTDLQRAISDAGAVVTHDPLPTVLADASQLSRVFQNLLSNALKFRGQQPPQIHVSAAREGEEWIFSVRDNGIGLDPKYAERIFVIFQRLHPPQKYPGTGIGLAICKKIIEQHGGRIGVQSTPGAGATFYFTVPVRARGNDA